MRVLELTDGIRNIVKGFSVESRDAEKWTLKASDTVFLPILELDIRTLNAFAGIDNAVRFEAFYRKDAEGYHLILNVYIAGILNDNLSAEITTKEDFMGLDVTETKVNSLLENWKELITTDMLKEWAKENNLTLIEDKDSYKEKVVHDLCLADVSDLIENSDLSDILEYKNTWDVKDFVIDFIRDNL